MLVSTRLTRLQQLTLNTWRRAAAKVDRELAPNAVLEQAAMCVVLAVLRDTAEPMALFARHAHAVDEFALLTSIVPRGRRPSLDHGLLDTAFLLRWQELTAGAAGPQELPPLVPRSLGPRDASQNSESGRHAPPALTQRVMRLKRAGPASNDIAIELLVAGSRLARLVRRVQARGCPSMPRNQHPKSLEEFERDCSVYGTPSPTEDRRVDVEMSEAHLLSAEDHVEDSRALLDALDPAKLDHPRSGTSTAGTD